MKRFLSVLLAIAALFSLLTACNNDADTSKGGKVTVTFSGHGDQAEIDVFNQLVKAFNDKNPDITVKYTPVPADYVTKTSTALMGGGGADVFYVPDANFGQWVSQGFLLDMQSYIDQSSLNMGDVWPNAIERYRYDGTNTWKGNVYSLPKDLGPTVLYYNKDLFKSMGVEFPPADRPMTWAELLDRCKKLSKDLDGDGANDQFGIGPIWWESFIWSNGGDVLSEDRKTFVMNEPAAVEGLQFAADLATVHKVCPNVQERQTMGDVQMFSTGRLGMVFGGRWYTPSFRKLSFDWDVCYLPTGSKNIVSGWSGTVGLSINKKCKNPDAAFKFIEFVSGEEGQKAQTELGFTLPIYKSMAESDVFRQPGQKPESADVFIKSAEMQTPTPNTWLPNLKWWDVFEGALSDVWEGKKSAKAAMDEVKPQVEEAIKEGNPHLFK